MSRPIVKALYGLLGAGIALMYFGHGILGLKGYEKFTELITANYDKVLGGTMSADTATTWANVIGGIDVVLAAGFALLVVAALQDRGLAYSRLAMGLFSWAALWGFLTALSRFTATMNGAEIWDVVERGANFMAPAALVYLIYAVRREREEPVAEEEAPPRESVRERLRHAIPAH